MQNEKLEQIILTEVENVVGMVPENKTDNLIQFLEDNKKSMADLLYIVDSLEKKLKIPVGKSIAKRSYSVMTVQELAIALPCIYTGCVIFTYFYNSI